MTPEQIISQLVTIVQTIEPADANEAQASVKELKKLNTAVMEHLAKIGLEYELYISIDGSHLLLEDDSYSGFSKGEWLSSSYSC